MSTTERPRSRPPLRPPTESDFSHRLRGAVVTARVGTWLGVCFLIAFVTGLISHYAQEPNQPIPFPTSPAWGYRVTQGLHIITGTAAVPLLLVKLWSVYPKLFAVPPKRARELAIEVAERASIAVLVAAAIFQLVSGLQNIAHWYTWPFSFRSVHYAVGWLVTGALLLHIAVKLPVIRGAYATPVRDDEPASPGSLDRRGLLRATWAATAVAVLATAGTTVPWLRRVSVLGVRSGDGPQGLPVNRSARAAGVTSRATSGRYTLEVVAGDRTVSLTRDDLLAMTQRTESLPIACVEGWSASAVWTGVRVRDLLDLVEAPRDSDVRVVSLQQRGAFGITHLPGNFADDDRTLLALALHGEPLALDHGYPARLIAPNRPGVLQTKWVTRLEVTA